MTDDRMALAEETVWRAVLGYRDNVLIPGKWDPRKGANLTTYFTGQCLYQFRNVYKKWWRETHGPEGTKPTRAITAETPELPIERSVNQPTPAGQAFTRVRIAEGLEHADAKDREILAWYADGYSYPEIEVLTGIERDAPLLRSIGESFDEADG